MSEYRRLVYYAFSLTKDKHYFKVSKYVSLLTKNKLDVVITKNPILILKLFCLQYFLKATHLLLVHTSFGSLISDPHTDRSFETKAWRGDLLYHFGFGALADSPNSLE